MKHFAIGLIACILISGCSMAVNYVPKSSNINIRKPSSHPIEVFQMNEDVPGKYIVLGSVSVGDGGMTMKCGYDDVINAAQEKAKNVGGDAIQIIQIKEPNYIMTSCYNLIANVLMIKNAVN